MLKSDGEMETGRDLPTHKIFQIVLSSGFFSVSFLCPWTVKVPSSLPFCLSLLELCTLWPETT